MKLISDSAMDFPPRRRTFFQNVERTFNVVIHPVRSRLRRLNEALFGGMAGEYDPDINLTDTQGGSLFYRKLTNNPSRDLNPLTQQRSLEIAQWLFDTNPVSKRILELTRDYILGEGVSVRAQGDEPERADIQNVIDQFWNDPYNNMDMKLFQHVLELGLFGEQVYPVKVNPVDGHVRLGYVDPGVISGVNSAIRNAGVPIDIETGNALNQLVTIQTKPQRLKVVALEENPDDEWYGRIKVLKENAADKDFPGMDDLDTFQNTDKNGNPTGETLRYVGSAFIFQINKPTNAQRGRSDLLALADWVDGYDQILFGEVDRNLLLRSFIWDVTMTGATDKQIQAYLDRNKAPRPGTVRAHNEKIVWQAVTPQLNAGDVQQSADTILSYIATGSGHPKIWLNGLLDVNKSSSSELGEPALKRLTTRQKYVKYIITQIITLVLDQAEMHGMLKKRTVQNGSMRPEQWNFSVHMPEIKSRDLATNSNALLACTQALAIAREDGAIDVDTEQEVLIMLLGQLGVDIDIDEMRKRIDASPPDPQQGTRILPMKSQVNQNRGGLASPVDTLRKTGSAP